MQLPSAAAPTLAAVSVSRIATQRPLQPIAPTHTPLIASPMPLTATFTTAPPLPTITLATPTRVLLPEAFVFGRSVQGRDLSARRIGSGPLMIMLVGGIHGGYETNTVDLINEMIAHFSGTPGDVLPGLTLVMVPALNPDGVAAGRVLEGRFNANGVDLNRNWDCGWEPVAFFQNREVSPGSSPFSEPESIALAALINEQRPDVVLFYHSAADGIFAGGCGGEDGGSAEMSRVLGEATGYSYGSGFSDYPVTGTAPAWVGALGIASADVELSTARSTEFERNLRGVMALQCWLLSRDPNVTPAACVK